MFEGQNKGIGGQAAVEAVNLLGGVDLEITKAEWADINSLITETVESTGIASALFSERDFSKRMKKALAISGNLCYSSQI